VIISAEYANKILKIIYKLLKFKVKMENKMTAVEWLWEQIDNAIPYQNIKTSQVFSELLEQAKQMEKQQHKNTWTDSRLRGDLYQNQIFYYQSFNDYFKLEYGGKDGE
jgi:hypothetical protein